MKIHNLALVVGFFILIGGLQAQAQSYLLDGNYYIRSDKNFLSDTNAPNVLGVLTAKSTFRVVSRTPTKSGEGLEIEITSYTSGSNLKESPTGRFFIYKPNSDGKRKESERHFKALNNNVAPMAAVEAGVATCENCDTTQRNSTSGNAVGSLSKITEEMLARQNEAPQPTAQKIEQAAGQTNTVVKSEPLVGPAQKGQLDEKIRKYSDSAEVKRMIEWGLKNNSKYKSGAGTCYRKVKEAMATKCGPAKGRPCTNIFAPEGGKSGPGNNLTTDVSTDIKDFNALSAKDRLKEKGFVNLLEVEPYKSDMRSPSNAPKGAILVYSSGIPCSVSRGGKVVASTKDCGHVEIKTGESGQKGYVSDYYSDTAINETPRARRFGSNYKLVGVMIKP